jgi:hypothetical protein
MTSQQEISDWFDRGVSRQAKYMVVVCDTFDYEDYPCFAATDDECLRKVENPGPAQRVMEVYDLTAPKGEQLAERRSMRLPS